MSEITPIPCIGIMGKLFGHKFTHGSYTRAFTHCLRCGAPAGHVRVPHEVEIDAPEDA